MDESRGTLRRFRGNVYRNFSIILALHFVAKAANLEMASASGLADRTQTVPGNWIPAPSRAFLGRLHGSGCCALPVTDSLPVRLHPLAEDDASAAYGWYLERNPIVAEIFFVELNSAMDRIAQNPRR